MKILIHDYAGHPFQTQLSHELARRGHSVTHAYFAGDKGPKGTMVDSDDVDLKFAPVGISGDYSKSNFVKRWAGDRKYGLAIKDLILKLSPDLVISGNSPTEIQEQVVKACKTANAKFIYWCQDFYSIAASRLLPKKLPVIGNLIGVYYRFLEKRQMHSADHIVHITESFCEQTDDWGVSRDKISIIPNWGAIDEIDVLNKTNDWSAEQGLSNQTNVVYSGTLALKHNPDLLLAVAQAIPEAKTVVICAGVGKDYLTDEKEKQSLENLKLLPLQPFDLFSQVLASATVLVAVIEREAGEFSVPSKILSYLCAGRPIVLAAPKENLAAKIVADTGAGLVVEPEDIDGFVKSVSSFLSDEKAMDAAGKAGRAYAEKTFLINNVADSFEGAFAKAMQPSSNVT